MKHKKCCSFPCLGRVLLLLFSFTSLGEDTITSKKFIKDPASIISNGSSFRLGFFTPLNSTGRYVGIWFNHISSSQTIVWVANRDKPLNNTSGIFTIYKDGNLVVLDGNGTVLWSSNVSSSSSTTNTIARILDSGNLVLEDTTSGNTIWESFKHPSDKFLNSMKLITNKRTKEKVKLTSWNTPFNPSTGNFSLALEVLTLPEVVIWKNNNNNNNPYWRSGPWNGRSFTGIPDMDLDYISGLNLFIANQTYTLSIPRNYHIQYFAYLALTSRGNLELTNWDTEKKHWNAGWSLLKTECDYYGTCGAFGICNPKASPICSCLKGFKPKNEKEWNEGNWSGGCVRRTPLQCININGRAEEDGFVSVEMVKLPFFVEWFILGYTEEDCKQECLRNCSCKAYAYENGIRCMLWKSDELIDIQKFEIRGATLHLRMAYAELDHTCTLFLKFYH
ncbi:G-type lectin S-receptor-like serine/threonine-protein kinase At1g11300 isoform X1 [Benincasa hispida]|uniref:G-type lectin S-receptor-like serine/threonine-protein kinase At1g11300 isoform X1 n=1 Tax=Benincasa hispida TaxID=102211 RepID=UPI0018FF7948|nr:G-type lectin S-receptor-like serine/threonine-protein kinase At1g11300 isoform X1 [Benincasa hispida]